MASVSPLGVRAWVIFPAVLCACGEPVVYRSDIRPVTNVAEAKPGVFIPPFRECKSPLPGETGNGPNGTVCTNVAISGSTEADKSFAAYAACDVVRTQRPYWSAPPARVPAADDPRLSDAAYLDDLAWVKSQIASSGCVCCHDSRVVASAQWDIDRGPLWLDSLSDPGLALFTGLADSTVLGAYPKHENNGFDRTITGIPTNDTPRMQAILFRELERRGITREQAAAVPPFGGPIYANQVTPPGVCTAGEGVTSDGRVLWKAGGARYVYVMAESAKNPGVPPNLDLPSGTIWRLDVLARADAVQSGISYGTTPPGTFQAVPDRVRAPLLVAGTKYHFTVLRDVGVPATNCIFTYPAAPAPVTDAGPGPGPSCDAGTALGRACTDNAACGCGAPYCALQPGQTQGYCTVTGCKEDPGVCAAGWSCFDLGVFAPGQPSICTKP